jgi:hypothetical protein
MLDRLLAGLAYAVALAAVALAWRLGVPGAYALGAAGAVIVAWLVLHVALSKARGDVDPGAQMLDRASHIAKLFPAPFVVMGHTHVPMSRPIEGDATYINLGSWAEEEPDPAAPPDAHVYRAALALSDHEVRPRRVRTRSSAIGRRSLVGLFPTSNHKLARKFLS